MLTKSLHTVTAVTNVARYLNAQGKAPRNADGLAHMALAVLGYGDVDTHSKRDDTVQRCVASVAKLLTEESDQSKPSRRARKVLDQHGREIDAVYTEDGTRVSLAALR